MTISNPRSITLYRSLCGKEIKVTSFSDLAIWINLLSKKYQLSKKRDAQMHKLYKQECSRNFGGN